MKRRVETKSGGKKNTVEEDRCENNDNLLPVKRQLFGRRWQRRQRDDWTGRKEGRKDAAVAAATCHPDQRTVTLLLLPRGQDARARGRKSEREIRTESVRSGPVKGAKRFSHVHVVAFPPRRSIYIIIILLYYYFIVVETRQWRPHVFLPCKKKTYFYFRNASSAVCLSGFCSSAFYYYTYGDVLLSQPSNILRYARNFNKKKY